MGATNIVTGESYPDVSDKARDAIGDIEWSDNNGWSNGRDTAVVPLADSQAAKETGSYAGRLLPDGITDGHLEHVQVLAQLASLVPDDRLRERSVEY